MAKSTKAKRRRGGVSKAAPRKGDKVTEYSSRRPRQTAEQVAAATGKPLSDVKKRLKKR